MEKASSTLFYCSTCHRGQRTYLADTLGVEQVPPDTIARCCAGCAYLIRYEPRPAEWGRRPALDRSSQISLLRDVVIRAHELASGHYVDSTETRLQRIAALTDAAIDADPVMRGFLGRGGPEAARNLLGGSGNLDLTP